MTCRDVAALVTEYLEGKLPLADQLRFQLHLGLCTMCRAHLEQMRATIRAAGRVADLDKDVPPETRDELLRRFRTWRKP